VTAIADTVASLGRLAPDVRELQLNQILGKPSDKIGLAYNAQLMTALRMANVWPPE